ncbi:hypothetical protein [Streptomyces guryensis]|uniref:Uncharacterized protein n=1 Tax=Streptomyces guryensis TaxID=2886947 RepID=A0A9Q3W0A3_9ACTN|nr:hypothetical protein [Streptomyces guryensis]MCD9880898.1 hypothetical protein [Streptomyces guryensis]
MSPPPLTLPVQTSMSAELFHVTAQMGQVDEVLAGRPAHGPAPHPTRTERRIIEIRALRR